MIKKILYAVLAFYFIRKYNMDKKIENLYLPVHCILAILREFCKRIWETGNIMVWVIEIIIFIILFIVSVRQEETK